MVIVHTDMGKFRLDFTPGMTVAQAMQATYDAGGLETRGPMNLQETQSGRVLGMDEEIINDRYYFLNGFVQRRGQRKRGVLSV